MALDHILLGLLREPASGYDLKRTFDDGVGHFWPASLSQIYPTLKRLEKRGLLDRRTEPSERGPDRRVYSLTDDGRRALEKWLSSGPEVATERFGYLAQLFLMDALGDEEATLEFMHDLRDHLASWHSELEGVQREIDEHGSWVEFPSTEFHRYASLRMGVMSLRAKVAWCEETIERLEARRQAGRSLSLAARRDDAASPPPASSTSAQSRATGPGENHSKEQAR